jgi:hypothetical protein
MTVLPPDKRFSSKLFAALVSLISSVRVAASIDKPGGSVVTYTILHPFNYKVFTVWYLAISPWGIRLAILPPLMLASLFNVMESSICAESGNSLSGACWGNIYCSLLFQVDLQNPDLSIHSVQFDEAIILPRKVATINAGIILHN